MYACKQFTVPGIQPIAEFYLSAAGIKNAVTVFHKSDKTSIIQLIRLVTGLSYHEEGAESTKPKKKEEAKDAPREN